MRRSTTMPQLVTGHFVVSSLQWCKNVFIMQVSIQNYHCVPQNHRQRCSSLYWTKEHVSWARQLWTSVRFIEESKFTLKSNSKYLPIWREKFTRNNKSNNIERHNYRGGGILVWAEISFDGHTELQVICGEILTEVRYRGGDP
ncbi:transposable element Tcb2 transposase [Trichonephila clavipes]|nr:transposable element Tcb2 transposase [Trichonephila clavipes]